jgi:uncharacterized oligopeptide transporter (OPT) family protein
MAVRRVAVGTLSGAVFILVALVALALFVQFPMALTWKGLSPPHAAGFPPWRSGG